MKPWTCPATLARNTLYENLFPYWKLLYIQNSQLLKKLDRIITLRESQKTAKIIEKENRPPALMPLTPVQPSPRESALQCETRVQSSSCVKSNSKHRPNGEEAQGQGLSFVKIQDLKKKSSLRSNFTVNFFRHLFWREVQGRNMAGKKGKPPNDPFHVELMKSYVFQMYPAAPVDIHNCWRKCIITMDKFIWRPVKRRHWTLQV